MTIGYLGPQGTFTHVACQKACDGALKLTPFMSLDRLFDALNEGVISAIFSPFENAIEGPVNRVLDGLLQTNTIITNMYEMPIRQSLLALDPTLSINHITHVVSMPHAIAQCYRFIKQYCPNATLHHAPSTAGSVPVIDSLKLPTDSTAIIGYAGMTDYFPVHVIQTDIHDQQQNVTEFCIIRPITSHNTVPHPTKGLMAFSTPKDQPGSLLSTLTIFKDHGINMTKILSRPQKTNIGAYIFYIEYDMTAVSLETIQSLTNQIKGRALYFKHLGHYESQSIDA